MKALIYSSILFLSLKSYAQIEQVEVKTITNDININVKKNDSIVGQEVLILPKSHKYVSNDEFRFYGYGGEKVSLSWGIYNNHKDAYNEDFETQISPPYDLHKSRIYKPVRTACNCDQCAKQNPGHEDFFFAHVSDYNSLAGKKFRIIDILERGTGKYYKLENEENGDQFYYSCRGGAIDIYDIYTVHPPILVLSNFEKLKNIYLNKDFIYIQSFGLIDNNSGQSLDNIAKSEWKCIKIALADYSDNPYQKITFILNNNTGNQIAVELGVFKKNFINKVQYLQEIETERIKAEDRKAEQEKIAKEQANQEKTRAEEKKQMQERISKEEANREKQQVDEEKKEKLAAIKNAEITKNKKIANDEIAKKRREDFIKKFGNKYGALIADGQVKIGMTKEMCIAAFGNPDEKGKQNSVLEKWVYKSKYLYFDKSGILTAIQK